jgi:hypothetical protein
MMPWLRISAGAMVWALHFAAIYGITALACARGSAGPVPWAIGIATIVAVGLVFFLIWISFKDIGAFANWLSAAVAGLALLAIVWEAVPVLLVPACA